MAAMLPTSVPPLIAAAPALTEGEQELVARKLSALQRILTDESSTAKYKLEVMFGKARSSRRPTPGVLSFWENGSKLHGGGDAKLYLCPGRYLKKSDCEAVMPDAANSEGSIVCTACGTVWAGEQVIGELLFNLPMRKWAEVLYRYYCKFSMECDLYLKHAPDDIRSVALAQSERQTWRGTQLLDRSRNTRARVVYKNAKIIADTSTGADPVERFYMFVTA